MIRFLFNLIFTALIITSPNCMGAKKTPVTGAKQIELYKYLLEGKSVAVVANQTSMVGKKHLVDTLISLGIKVRLIFAPEHGFRNLADAGERINDGIDLKTGLRLSACMALI